MMATFAENFKAAREFRGMTLAEVGEKLGRTRQQIQRYEKDVMPSLRMALKLADTLDMPIDVIVGKASLDEDDRSLNLEEMQ